MCVGVAGRVMSVRGTTAIVDASGVRREVSAALLDALDPGDFVMVHAGMAIAKINGDDTAEGEAVMGAL